MSEPTTIAVEVILSLIPELGCSEYEAEKQAGVPRGFIRYGRQGWKRDVQSEPGWQKILELLVKKLGGERVLAALEAAKPKTPPPAPATPVDDLADLLAKADSIEALLTVERRIGADLARGLINPDKAHELLATCRELRQTIEIATAARKADDPEVARLEALAPRALLAEYAAALDRIEGRES